MDKKNRTGLQSKISHIFAGVPMPKKKSDQSEQEDSVKEDKITEKIEPVSDDIVIEDTANEQQIESTNLEDDIYEVSLSQDEFDDQEQILSQQEEESKKVEPKPLESIHKPEVNKQFEDKLPKEQFIKTSEPAFTEKTTQPETEPEEVKQSNKASGSEYRVDTLSNLLASNDSVSLDKDKKSNTKDEEKQTEEPSKASFASETNNEKPRIKLNKKYTMLGLQKADSSPKPLVEKVSKPKEEEIKKITRVPKRSQLKQAGKKVKSQPTASQSRQKYMVGLIIFFSILLVVLLLRNSGYFESTPNNSGTIIDPLPIANTGSNNPERLLAINWPQPPVYPENLRDPMEVTDQFVEEVEIIEHPALEISGTSTVQGGNYMVTIGNNPLPFRADSVINDSKGREVKIIDIKLNQVVFEMGSVLWTYDLRSKEWNQNDSEDILGD